MAGPWKAVGRYGAVGLELVIAVVAVAAAGAWLDRRYWGGHGWGVAAGLVLGLVVGIRNLMRTAKNMQRDIEREEARDPLAGRWTVDENWVHKDDAGRKQIRAIQMASFSPAAGRAVRETMWAVAGSGAALALAAFAFGGTRAGLSAAAGAGLAAGNLWTWTWLVSALLPGHASGARAQRPAAWALVAALKMVAMISVAWLLMRHGVASPGSMLVGLLSLPIGIAIGSLVSHRSAVPEDL